MRNVIWAEGTKRGESQPNSPTEGIAQPDAAGGNGLFQAEQVAV